MFSKPSFVVSFALFLIAVPVAAQAGMPSVLPSDLETRWVQSYETKLRLESISFFLVGLLACIFAVKFLWNSLASSVPSLPRLDFVRAFAVVALWGLVFTLVLTMISGARELLTPGAWKQNGFTYELDSGPDPSESPTTLDQGSP